MKDVDLSDKVHFHVNNLFYLNLIRVIKVPTSTEGFSSVMVFVQT